MEHASPDLQQMIRMRAEFGQGSEQEEAYAKILRDNSRPPFRAAEKFPLITFSHTSSPHASDWVPSDRKPGGDSDSPSMKFFAGDIDDQLRREHASKYRSSSQKVAALGYRWGIPENALSACAVNLAVETERDWLRTANWLGCWSGVWIILGTITNEGITVSTGICDIRLGSRVVNGQDYLAFLGEAIKAGPQLKHVILLPDRGQMLDETNPLLEAPARFAMSLSDAIADIMLHNPRILIPSYDVNIVCEGADAGTIKAVRGQTEVTPETAMQLLGGTKLSGAWNIGQVPTQDMQKKLKRARKKAQRAVDSKRAAVEEAQKALEEAELRLQQITDKIDALNAKPGSRS